MFSINLYNNFQNYFKQRQFLEKESYIKSNIITKLKLSNKHKNDYTKKYYIENNKVSYERAEFVQALNKSSNTITWEKIISGFMKKADDNYNTNIIKFMN